jgi:hypothetical protein
MPYLHDDGLEPYELFMNVDKLRAANWDLRFAQAPETHEFLGLKYSVDRHGTISAYRVYRRRRLDGVLEEVDYVWDIPDYQLLSDIESLDSVEHERILCLREAYAQE